MRDSNNVPIKAIEDRLIKWEEFFEVKLNHDAPSVVSQDIADSLDESHTVNRQKKRK